MEVSIISILFFEVVANASKMVILCNVMADIKYIYIYIYYFVRGVMHSLFLRGHEWGGSSCDAQQPQ